MHSLYSWHEWQEVEIGHAIYPKVENAAPYPKDVLIGKTMEGIQKQE